MNVNQPWNYQDMDLDDLTETQEESVQDGHIHKSKLVTLRRSETISSKNL